MMLVFYIDFILALHGSTSALDTEVQCILKWLVIRTSIIWHLDYPNTKFHKPHPHLQKPCGSWRLRYLTKCCFPIVKVTRSAENVLIIEEKLDICKLMTTDRSYTERYGSRWSTTVTKILKENVRHGHGKKTLEDRTPDIHKIDNT